MFWGIIIIIFIFLLWIAAKGIISAFFGVGSYFIGFFAARLWGSKLGIAIANYPVVLNVKEDYYNGMLAKALEESGSGYTPETLNQLLNDPATKALIASDPAYREMVVAFQEALSNIEQIVQVITDAVCWCIGFIFVFMIAKWIFELIGIIFNFLVVDEQEESIKA